MPKAMPKACLFDEDSEEDVSIKTENAYAKKYDAWREKEELHKLEQKYGSKPVNAEVALSSDSEDESDEPPEISEEVEKQFLKTLALLKTKDPRIYDADYKFFDDKIDKEKEKEPETKKLTFGDSDDDDDDDDSNIFSIEKKAEIDHSDDEKSSKEKSSKNEKIKDFLTGKADHVDEDVEKDLEPLRALWSDPKLNDGEAFLRDYILNKRYLEDGDVGEAGDRIRDDDDLEEDEKTVEEQGKFERAYNFRFEEPDEEYLKRFPRTMNYIRPKDERRSRKRAELRERKLRERSCKMEEIARMKALKLKEIKEKIDKIREVTGNHDLAFKDEDIEGDFDPEEHDRRMKALFDEEYYGDVDDKKPVFPDLDEELEIENWEKYEQEYEQNNDNQCEEPHCEDKDFNMDADYDPKKAKENLLEELKRNMGKKRRNRKRKSKLAELLSEEKPKFVPDLDKTYSEFMKEYYEMDCEDIIGGDLPTRFKYREVVPNDFGLTVEEILLADDKELTQWVPLKKIVKYRPENVEKGEVKTYSQKAADVTLKKKILPSLFKDLPEEPEIVVPIEATKKKKKKKKQKKVNSTQDEVVPENIEELQDNSNTDSPEKKKRKHTDNNDTENEIEEKKKEEKKKKKHKKSNKPIVDENSEVLQGNVKDNVSNIDQEFKVAEESNEVKTAETSQDNKKKKKHKKAKKQNVDGADNTNNTEINKMATVESNKIEASTSAINNITSEGKKKNKKPKTSFNVENVKNKASPSSAMSNQNGNVGKNLKRKLDTKTDIPKKKKKNNQQNTNKNDGKKFKGNKQTNKQNDNSDPLSKLSDERLKAYGLNPKKYRGFLKYKKF